MGRKYKDIDKRVFEELCKIQCTKEEICGVLDCDDKTLDSWVKRTYDNATCGEVCKKLRLSGKASLRRSAWLLSQKNARMCEFLLKNYLDMVDKTETKQEDTVIIVNDLRDEN